MNDTKEKKKSIFSFKNLFFLIIILSLAQPVFNNLRKQLKESLYPNTHVGCLRLSGLIYNSHFYVKQINKFLKKPEIKALVLKINSPGGTPGTSQAIFNELKKFKEKKPIIAMVEDLNASAAYYISAAADKIVANPSSLIGSIGVFMQLPNVKTLLDNWNVKMELVKSGKFKLTTSPFRDKTPEELLHLQGIVDDSYMQFIKDVAEARNLDLNKKEQWADGKIFTGNQALKLGLIDQLGSVTDVKQILAKILTERGVEVVGKIKLVYPKRLTGFAKIMYGDTEDLNNNALTGKVAGFVSTVLEKVVINQNAKQARLH